jgi:hypothetical protein
MSELRVENAGGRSNRLGLLFLKMRVRDSVKHSLNILRYMKATMDLIHTTGTSSVANLLLQKNILRGFVTPVFIHLADDNYTVDLASRKGMVSKQLAAAAPSGPRNTDRCKSGPQIGEIERNLAIYNILQRPSRRGWEPAA